MMRAALVVASLLAATACLATQNLVVSKPDADAPTLPERAGPCLERVVVMTAS